MKKVRFLSTFVIAVLMIQMFTFSPSTARMEPMPDKNETYQDYISFLENKSANIDIKVIGNVEISNEVQISIPDNDKIKAELQNMITEKEAIEAANIISPKSGGAEYKSINKKISQESMNSTEKQSEYKLKRDEIIEKNSKSVVLNVENIKKTEKTKVLNSTKEKLNKDQLLSVFIANDQINDFFSDQNTVKKLLNKGYTIFFEVNNNKEMDEVYHAYGLIDTMEENYQMEFEDKEQRPIAAYMVKNKIGEYGTGSIYTDGSKSTKYMLLQSFKIRNYYFCDFKNFESLDDELNKNQFSVSANNPPEDSVGENWSFIKWTEKTFYGNTNSSDTPTGSILFRCSYYNYNKRVLSPGSMTSYDRYFAVLSTMIVDPNDLSNHRFNYVNYLEFSLNLNIYTSIIKLYEVQPKNRPEDYTVSFGVGANLDNTGKGALSISWSTSHNYSDLSITDYSSYTSNKAKIRYDYNKEWNWLDGYVETTYAKNPSTQKAVVVGRLPTNITAIALVPTIEGSVSGLGHMETIESDQKKTYIPFPNIK